MSLQETTDKKTLALIDAIKKQKQEIAKAEKPNWKTNCVFSFSGFRDGPPSVNLHVENNIATLVRIASVVIDAEASYKNAAKAIGVEAPEFLWCGSPAADWLEDVTTRVNRVQIGDKKAKLEMLEARLNKIISPALRAEMELEDIANLLK